MRKVRWRPIGPKNFVRLLICVLFVGIHFGLVAALAQENRWPTAGRNEALLRFRRVYVLADRLREWPRENVPYVPVDPNEFERVLAFLADQQSADRSTSSSFIRLAHYYARLVGGNLVDGQAILDVQSQDGHPQGILTRVLGPLSIPVGPLTWMERDGQPARWGSSGSGKHKLVVDGSGTIMFRWSAAGSRRADGGFGFSLRLPAAEETRLIIDAPAQFSLVTDLLSWSEDVEDRLIRRWIVVLGGRTSCQLAFVPTESAGYRPQASWLMSYVVSLEGVEALVRLGLSVGEGELRTIVLAVPPGFVVYDVTSDQPGHVAWEFRPGTREAGFGELALTFSPALEGIRAEVTIRALAPAPPQSEWTILPWQCDGAAWRQSKVEVTVKPPLQLALCTVQGGYRLAIPEGEQNTGGVIHAVYERPDGQVILQLFIPAALYSVKELTSVRLMGPQVLALSTVALQAVQGERWQLRAEVPEGWSVDIVESPQKAVASWEIEQASADQGEGGQTLRINLTRPLPLSEPVTVRVSCRRKIPSSLAQIPVNGMLPLRWPEACTSEHWLVLRADVPWQWTGEGVAEKVTAADRVLEMLTKLAQLPPDAEVWQLKFWPGAEIRLARSVGYRAWAQTAMWVEGDDVRTKGFVLCSPEAGGFVDQVRIAVAGRGGEDRRWIARLCEVRKRDSKGIEVIPGEVLPVRVDREGSSTGDVWLITLGKPANTPIFFEHEADYPFDDESFVPLVWVPEAAEQHLELVIRAVKQELVLEADAEAVWPSWGPVVRLGADEKEASGCGGEEAQYWFRYHPPSGAKQSGEQAGLRVRARRTAAAQKKAWISSAVYQTTVRPARPLRHRAILAIQSPSPGELICAWRQPVRIIAVSEDGKAQWSAPERQHFAVSMAVSGESSKHYLGSDVTSFGEQSVTEGQRASSPGFIRAENALINELTIPLSGQTCPTFVEIIWEELEEVSGWGTRLRPPHLDYNLPVVRSSWTIWCPPGWEIERAGPLTDVGVETLFRRLFGGLARREGASVFDPVGLITPRFARWSEPGTATGLIALRQVSELIAGPDTGEAAKVSLQGTLSPELRARSTITWGELLGRVAWGGADRVPGEQEASADSAQLQDVDKGHPHSVDIPPIVVDAAALAAAGLTPRTPVSIPVGGGVRGFLTLLRHHGLSIIVYRRVFLLTTAAEAALLASRYAHETLTPAALGQEPRLVLRESGTNPEFLAMAVGPRTTAATGSRPNPRDLSAAAEETRGVSASSAEKQHGGVFTPVGLLVLGMNDARFDEFVDDLLSGRTGGGLRYLPAALWAKGALADFWETVKPGETSLANEPILGWQLAAVVDDENSEAQFTVFRRAVHNVARIAMAFVAIAVVTTMGVRGFWPCFYWLAGAASLSLGLLVGGIWAAGAGGWLLGQLVGLGFVALWTRPSFPQPGSGRKEGPGPEGPEEPPPAATCARPDDQHASGGERSGQQPLSQATAPIFLEDTGICRRGQTDKSTESMTDPRVELGQTLSCLTGENAGKNQPAWERIGLSTDGTEAVRFVNGEYVAGQSGADPVAKNHAGQGNQTHVSDRPSSHLGGGGSCVWGILLAIVGWVVSLSCAVGFAQMSEPAGSPSVQTYRVLIPVDAQGQPSGEKYQVPEPMWTKITRLVAEAEDRWLISAAQYRARLVRLPEKGTWTVPEIQVNFQVDVLQAPAQLPLTFPGTKDALPPNVYVNGRPAVVTVNELDGSFLVELPSAGLNEVEVVFTPPIWTEGEYNYAVWPVPPVANSWLQLGAAPEAPTVEIVGAQGPVLRNPAGKSVEALLGPVSELRLRWAAREDRPADEDVRALMLVGIDSGMLTANLVLKSSDGGRLPQILEFELDPEWEPAVSGEGLLEALPGEPRRSWMTYRLGLAEQSRLRGQARLRLVRRGEVAGHFYPSFFRPKSFRLISYWIGFEASPSYQVQVLDTTKGEIVPAPAFTEAWGEDVPNLSGAWNVPVGRRDWAFVIRRIAGKMSGKQFLQLVLRPEGLRCQYLLQIELQNEEVFQYRWALPPMFVLETLELERQDGGTAPLSGLRDDEGNLVVNLAAPVRGSHRVRLSGRCLVPVADGWSLPLIRVLRQEVEPLRVDVWAALGLSVTMKPTAAVQPQPLTPFALPEDARFLGSFELESGQKDAARCTIRLDRPRITGRQVIRLVRGREGWSAESVWALSITNGSVSRLEVRIPPWAVGPATVDPPGELRAELPNKSAELGVPAEASQAAARPAEEGPVGFTRPGESRSRSEAARANAQAGRPVAASADSFIKANIEFDRALTGYRAVRVGRLAVVGNRLLRIPVVDLPGAEITERYLIVPENTELTFVDLPPGRLQPASLPQGMEELVPAGSHRCFQMVGKVDRLTALSVRTDPVVRLAVVRGRIYRDGRFVGIVQWDIDPAGNTELRVEVPAEVTLLDWHVSGGYAFRSDRERIWRLRLAHPGLPAVVSIFFLSQSRLNGASWLAPRARLIVPTVLGARQRESCWILSFDRSAADVALFSADQDDLSLPAQPLAVVALERFRSQAALLRQATGELPALSPAELGWIEAWENTWLWTQQIFPWHRFSRALTDSDIEGEFLSLFREVNSMRRQWPGMDQGSSPSCPPLGMQTVLIASQEPGAVTRCWIDSAGGREAVVAWSVNWWSKLGGFLGGVALVAGGLIPGVFPKIRARLGGLARRWPFVILALGGLVWWLWFTPSALGFLVLVGAAAAGFFYRAYGLAAFSSEV